MCIRDRYFLAQLAREEVTVVLSGEGADEIFAGYEWYADTPAMEKFKRLPLGVRRAAAAAAKKLPYFKGKNFLLKCSEDVYKRQGSYRTQNARGYFSGASPARSPETQPQKQARRRASRI